MRHPTEDELKGAVIELAETLGWHCYSVRRSDLARVQGRSGRGFPDLVLARSATLLFVELKSARGRLSQSQARWRAVLEDAGARWALWRPADWQSGEIERRLRPPARPRPA